VNDNIAFITFGFSLSISHSYEFYFYEEVLFQVFKREEWISFQWVPFAVELEFLNPCSVSSESIAKKKQFI